MKVLLLQAGLVGAPKVLETRDINRL